MNRELPAHQVFRPPEILGWALRAALAGRPGVMRDFVVLGRRGARVTREIERRRRLLAAVSRN